MPRIAVFAGTFDPFTLGHQDIAQRGLALYDKLVIAIGLNALKHPFFSTEARIAMIRDAFPNEPRLEGRAYYRSSQPHDSPQRGNGLFDEPPRTRSYNLHGGARSPIPRSRSASFLAPRSRYNALFTPLVQCCCICIH